MLAATVSYIDLLKIREGLITARYRLTCAQTEPSGQMLLKDMLAALAAVQDTLGRVGAAIDRVESEELTHA